jgi:hypothetical protein
MCVQSLQHKPRRKRPRAFTQLRVGNCSNDCVSQSASDVVRNSEADPAPQPAIVPVRPLT